MNLYLIIISLFILIYYLNEYFRKKNLLLNFRGYVHQKFSGQKNIPLSGGLFLIISLIILLSTNNSNYLLLTFLSLIFFIGFASDINFLSSPKIRLIIQIIIISIFVIILDVRIAQTKFLLIDLLLENDYFKYFFSIFCLLILINGSNFIDGLNGLLLGYFTLIIFILLYLNSNLNFKILFHNNILICFVIIMIYLFILNIYYKLFMGDSGSYILGFFTGYNLIRFYEFNQEISPYFIVLLLWYPCFENFFSIVRKFSLKKSPSNADNNHLHQLIFTYIKKKKFLKKFDANNVSSIFILIYNFIVFILSLVDISNSQLQIFLLVINIIVYIIVYLRLFNFKYKIKY